MKPIVGVLPLWDDEKESIWMLLGYFNGIEEAGGMHAFKKVCVGITVASRVCL